MNKFSGTGGLTFAALAASGVFLLAAGLGGWQLHRLAELRTRATSLRQDNLQELQVSAESAELLTSERTALRELIVANARQDVSDADARFEAIGRRFDDVQTQLTGLFAADPQTTEDERVLLHRVQAEHLATLAPLRRLAMLAARNHDEEATKLLDEAVLPHQQAILEGLATLDLAQQEQNRALARATGEDYRLVALSTALLGVLGGASMGGAGWLAFRRRR